ncbi:hypothetical protein TYRP_006865 [Tyrophagus putrescentiae]|nr:hypothetical protein TYRP_006865 [Tyrophagus putrescentiae]
MGAVILLSNCGTNWHVASASIASPYRAFSREKIFADVGVHIGLDSVNITLKALPIHPRAADINYNERFYWIGPVNDAEKHQHQHQHQAKCARADKFAIAAPLHTANVTSSAEFAAA